LAFARFGIIIGGKVQGISTHISVDKDNIVEGQG